MAPEKKMKIQGASKKDHLFFIAIIGERDRRVAIRKGIETFILFQAKAAIMKNNNKLASTQLNTHDNLHEFRLTEMDSISPFPFDIGSIFEVFSFSLTPSEVPLIYCSILSSPVARREQF